MDDSILNTIKKMLGLDASYDAFDTDIIVNINSVIQALSQLGVCYSDYSISGVNDTWSSLVKDFKDVNSVKTYIYIKVRNLFDPPTSSYVLQALNEQAKEIEWRLLMEVEEVRNE
jgi:hypothetical protein